MLVGILSDVHLEFGLGELVIPKCDLLVLAGDITNARNTQHNRNFAQKLTKRNKAFFRMCESAAETVVYVSGNHEHYGSMFNETSDYIRDMIYPFKKINFLDNQAVTVGDIDIFGCTLWTDLKKYDPMVIETVKSRMNDYKLINKTQITTITPYDTIKENIFSKSKIREFLSKSRSNKTMIVSHQAPSWACVERKYSIDILSYAYANTDLDDMILDNDGPDYWVHGHMHKESDFMHGDKTRFLCNARGYFGYGKQRKVKLIEI